LKHHLFILAKSLKKQKSPDLTEDFCCPQGKAKRIIPSRD